jgi:hypothetical protein
MFFRVALRLVVDLASATLSLSHQLGVMVSVEASTMTGAPMLWQQSPSLCLFTYGVAGGVAKSLPFFDNNPHKILVASSIRLAIRDKLGVSFTVIDILASFEADLIDDLRY